MAKCRLHPGMRYGVAAFASPLFTVLMELKPSPFAFIPFTVPVAVSNFPLSLQLLLGRGVFLYSPPTQSPSSLCSQKHLPSRTFSLPKFTSLRHVPAEFCGSGCADCCVNPQISFLGVQDGLVLVSLYFMDARHTKNFHAVPPSWLLPPNPALILIFVPLYVNCHSLDILKLYPLSLFLSNFIVICLGVIFLPLYLHSKLSSQRPFSGSVSSQVHFPGDFFLDPFFSLSLLLSGFIQASGLVPIQTCLEPPKILHLPRTFPELQTHSSLPASPFPQDVLPSLLKLQPSGPLHTPPSKHLKHVQMTLVLS